MKAGTVVTELIAAEKAELGYFQIQSSSTSENSRTDHESLGPTIFSQRHGFGRFEEGVTAAIRKLNVY
jgi:hypothetical protein